MGKVEIPVEQGGDVSDNETKFFAVYGALRSGTTLLRLMLAAHTRLGCVGETDFLFDHLHRDTSGTWHLDATALERDRIYRAYRMAVSGAAPDRLTTDALIGRIAAPQQIAVLMLHRNLEKALMRYPEMRIVHLLRDPRDVARSSIAMGWAGDVYHGIGHWLQTERDWAACAPGFADDQVLGVRYEDLILNPEAELSRICAFAGVSYQPEMLDYDVSSTYSKPDISLINQWKTKLSDHELGLVEGRVGHLLAASGYDPSGVPPKTPTGLNMALLRLNNRRAVWRLRIRRYGLRDPLLVAVAHKLHLPSLGYGAQRRMDVKIKSYLK